MQEYQYKTFSLKTHQSNWQKNNPNICQFELTFGCGLHCRHCYTDCYNNSFHKKKELKSKEVKLLLDKIYDAGVVWVCFTGGDPLVRRDFLEIYSYAKKKGFLITVFTNGLLFTNRILDFLVKSPPYSIEITLNGITQETYEGITQVSGSFEKVIANIKEIKRRRLPLILKTNCLKQNKHELGKIKAFADELLGKSRGRYHFKYDPMIYPRLNGDRSSCAHRLSFGEIMEARKQDPDIWAEYQKGMRADILDINRDKAYLYRCNSWMSNFFINPYGRLKFCQFSDKFSVDLKTTSFHDGFYKVFPRLLSEKFKTNSKCINCRLRPICYHCPARAYLETGDEEAPVPYYCQLAKATAKEMGKK